MTDYDYLFKNLIIGDAGVGKSNLMMRYVDGRFCDNYVSTIGVDFQIKSVEISGKRIKLQLWDTAGQERFRTIVTSYYRGAHGCFLVFDLTDRPSFAHVSEWATEVKRWAAPKEPTIILIGNKADLASKRTVTYAEAKDLAESFGFEYYEVSAKNAFNVEEAFTALATNLLQNFKHFATKQKPEGFTIQSGPAARTWNCCQTQ